jgi:hypothetical protein
LPDDHEVAAAAEAPAEEDAPAERDVAEAVVEEEADAHADRVEDRSVRGDAAVAIEGAEAPPTEGLRR